MWINLKNNPNWPLREAFLWPAPKRTGEGPKKLAAQLIVREV